MGKGCLGRRKGDRSPHKSLLCPEGFFCRERGARCPSFGLQGAGGREELIRKGKLRPPALVFLPAILPSLVPLNQEPLTPEPGVGFFKSRHI